MTKTPTTLRLAAALTAALALALPSQAAANLVVNGGFEAIEVSSGSWLNVSSMPGWSLLTGSGNGFQGSGFEVRNDVDGSAYEGQNFIELDTNGNTSIAQSFANLVAGASYQLSFAYAPRQDVASGSNGIQVMWNGQQLGSTLTAQGGNVQGWTLYSFDVSALAGSNQLSFRAVGRSDGFGGSLDAVSLVSQVPEPTSYALMLAGLFAVAALKRRRQPAR